MSEVAITPTEKPWREMTDKELALSFVDFNTKSINAKIKSTETSLKFYENYKSGPSVSRPSHVKAGSMDASDWDVAEMEDEQFEYEKEDMIEAYKGEIEELREEFNAWDEDRGIIEAGDEDSAHVIKAHAALERDRREKLDEKSKPKQII